MSFSSPATAEITWSVDRLGDLIENLADRSGLVSHPSSLPKPPAGLSDRKYGSDGEAFNRWIGSACAQLGLESEPIDASYADFEKLLQSGAPLILRLPTPDTGEQSGFLGLLRAGKNRVTLLTPELKKRSLRLEQVRSWMTAHIESALEGQIDRMLASAKVPANRLSVARKAILANHLGSVPIQAGWQMRLSPGASIFKHLQNRKLLLPVAVMFSFHFIQQLLGLLAWVVIGRGIFQNQFDLGWMVAWVILLLSSIPLRLIVSDMQGEFSLGAGSVFKERLLYGITQLNPDEIRHLGMGQFLGRIMESEAVEMLAFGGGFSALLAVIEIGLAFYVLSHAAMGSFLIALLTLWVLVTLGLLWRGFQINREWAQVYREMTNELVENMVGHRTRLVQEDPLSWHEREDQLLNRYLKLSERVDAAGVQLQSFVGRGWLILGLTVVGLAFLSPGTSTQTLAIALGGVIFASQSLGHLTSGSQSLISLRIAWEQVGPLFKAAERPSESASLDFISFQTPVSPMNQQGTIDGSPDENLSGSILPVHRNETQQPVIIARDLVFRYRPQAKAVIDHITIQIHEGEKILLEGPSGGGKTTLAAVLTGLRLPENGSLLLWGMDRTIVGSQEWRRRVAMAPQFQENHVFSETFGFNLLMGRRWPPTTEDLAEAEALIYQLGLGDVFERMPSGFQQMLGESGWQLSHGERSRLFIARSLLQNSDLIILDESFGALDAYNLRLSLQTTLERAETLVVIAHP